MRLADLREEWFKEMADHGNVQIGFDRIDDDLVLTGSTEEVQAFLLRFGGNELAFPESSGWNFAARIERERQKGSTGGCEPERIRVFFKSPPQDDRPLWPPSADPKSCV